MPPCERFGVDHVVGHEDLRIEVVLDVLDRRAGEDLQGLLRLSELFGPRAVGLAAVGLGILAQEFRELVQEWDVRDGEGLAVLAVEGVLVPGDVVARRLRDPLAAREQVGEDLVGPERRPPLVDRVDHFGSGLDLGPQRDPVVLVEQRLGGIAEVPQPVALRGPRLGLRVADGVGERCHVLLCQRVHESRREYPADRVVRTT